MKELYINPSSQVFPTIQSAVFSIPRENTEPVIIRLAPGTYREKLVIDRPFLHIQGESPKTTRIVFGDYAKKPWEDGFQCGTFRSFSGLIDTHDFSAANISFVNDAGLGKDVGQAVALYVDGDRIVFENCRLLGSQDTLFTGPLPPKEIEPGGFRGPKEFAERINGRHYYRNCFIRGDIDFIFGSATDYFENCEIFAPRTDGGSYSKPVKTPASASAAAHTEHSDSAAAVSSVNMPKIYSYLTAASTPEGQEYGYVFESCRLTSDCPPASVYLGRPWRNYAKTVFLNCEMGAHIHPEGFHDWRKADAHDTCFYAEYNSYGPGASKDTRAPFVKQLTKEEASHYTKANVLAGEDDWIP